MKQVDNLTSQQKAFYDTFGFFVLREALTVDEIRNVEQEFEAVLAEAPVQDAVDGFDTTDDGRTIFKVGTQWFLARREDEIDKRPAFKALLESGRVGGTVKGLLGPGCYRTGNVAKRFASGTNWHSDLGWDPHFPLGTSDPGWPKGGPAKYYRGLKAAIYLEALTKETGALRVIPGSHRSPYHEGLASLHYQIPGRFEHVLEEPGFPQFGLTPPDVPSYAIESKPSDIVFFNHQLWHAAFGGKLGRRMITWDYKAKPEAEHERAYAEEFLTTQIID